MEEKEKDIIGSLQYVRFAEDNEYRFSMDHGFYKNVPSDINFYPVAETGNGLIEFVGNGYGMSEEYKRKGLSGEYGNGSIHVFNADIPHLVDWCRQNYI
jgi:hypothetical protein